VYQFGFKKCHSTALCTSVLKRTINSYVSSHVFACFVDFRKAFNRVNYWKLFTQLLDEGNDVGFVKLLAFWYSRQTISVYWQGLYSDQFTIGNGTRQGGVLSPFFTRYVRPQSTNQGHITKQCRMQYRWIVSQYTNICRRYKGCQKGTWPIKAGHPLQQFTVNIQ